MREFYIPTDALPDAIANNETVSVRAASDNKYTRVVLSSDYYSLKAEAVKLAAALSMCDPLPNLTDFHVLDELKYGEKTREAGKSRDIRSALTQWQAFLDEKGE